MPILKKPIAVCAHALVLIFGAGLVHAAGIPINLLPLGDSITQQGYYINPLVSDLSAAGYSATVLANEGHSGYIIDGSIQGAPRTGLAENIGAGKSTDFLNHPGVNASNTFILLMIGTNDVDTGFQLSTAQVQSRMGNLISEIRTEAPLAHLIVAKIVPIVGDATKNANVQQFNTDIAGVATGTNVSLVDMFTPINANTGLYMGDSLHPNQAGGDKMAEVWTAGIQAVPEPATAGLILIAGGAMLMRSRRRAV